LAVLIACRLTHTSFEVGEILVDVTNRYPTIPQTSTIYPTADSYDPDKPFSLAKELKYRAPPMGLKADLWKKIRHTNTHPSYVNLIQRKVELVIAAREPSDDEIVLARQRGVEIKTLPIARDALEFVIFWTNPVESLSIEQVRDVYSGGITNWADLEGQRGTIKPYRRDRNSGSEEKMKKLVMKGLATIGAQARTASGMFGPFTEITFNEGGIAYTAHYYERYMVNKSGVKIVAINNVMPSKETIANGAYPIVTEVVVAHLSDLPKESAAAKIRDWLLTTQGQEVVAESGYVPIKE